MEERYELRSRGSLLVGREEAAQRWTCSQSLKRLRYSDAGKRGCGTGDSDPIGLHTFTTEYWQWQSR